MPTSDELRALADAQDGLEAKERTALEAKALFANDPSDENRAALRTAIDDLAVAQMEFRQNPIAVVSTEHGSQTLIPAPLRTIAQGSGSVQEG